MRICIIRFMVFKKKKQITKHYSLHNKEWTSTLACQKHAT